MSNILAAIIISLMIAFAAYDVVVAIDCNSGIDAACEIRKASRSYEVEP